MIKPLSIGVIGIAAGMILLGSAQAQQTPPASAPQTPAAKSTKPATAKPGTTAAKKPAPLTLTTEKDKSSYAIGLNIGKSMRKDSVEVDTSILLRGLKDGLADAKPLLTDQEVKDTLTALQAELRAKQEAKVQAEADTNKKAGDAFLAENKTKEGVVTLPSGLEYKVLVAGTGPKPTASDTVLCNYKGTFLDNTEFDSSYKRGKPATFPVTGIIKGWSEALQLMPVGSKWQLFIPPDLAYGPSGRPGIAPNSTLVFEVELLSIQPKVETPAPPIAAPKPTVNPTPNPTPNPKR
jgi:FKBP-type peptidyl-prolyl cis-trans isomerase FklB